MSHPPAPPARRASGFFIAIGALAGALVGNHYGQASAGLLAGLGAGVLLAVLLWLKDRRRDR
jgi:uncharacterized membrane protein